FIPSRVPGGTDQPDFIPTRYHGALVQPLRVPQVAPALPRALPGDAALVRVLKRSGMPDTHNTGLRRAASVLLLVAGGGTHSYKRIGALTGLSESGTSKLVSSLRRRGWLRRSEHHRLVLTDAGWALLQQALIT
ncbi:MAG: MarR family transcriptional regulator, partial [Chitinophagaceae bacterium]